MTGIERSAVQNSSGCPSKRLACIRSHGWDPVPILHIVLTVMLTGSAFGPSIREKTTTKGGTLGSELMMETLFATPAMNRHRTSARSPGDLSSTCALVVAVRCGIA